jgi:hypothetical protein
MPGPTAKKKTARMNAAPWDRGSDRASILHEFGREGHQLDRRNGEILELTILLEIAKIAKQMERPPLGL